MLPFCEFNVTERGVKMGLFSRNALNAEKNNAALSQFERQKYRDVQTTQQLVRQTAAVPMGAAFSKKCAVAAAIASFAITWLLTGLIQFGMACINNWTSESSRLRPDGYIVSESIPVTNGLITETEKRYYQKDENGNRGLEYYQNPEDVPIPEWFSEKWTEQQANPLVSHGIGYYLIYPFSGPALQLFGWKLLIASVMTPVFWIVGYYSAEKYRAKYNAGLPNIYLNTHENDSHIQMPEEVMEKFDFVPDAGAHHDVAVSTLISHVFLDNTGIKKYKVTQRAEEDIYIDGELEYLKGEALQDGNGKILTKMVPLIDRVHGKQILDNCRIPKSAQSFYTASKILHNPKKLNDMRKDFTTVGQMINRTWTLPEYEPARPCGAYIVDTRPANTMVPTITRGYKGQCYIIPFLDVLTRKRNQDNCVCNDPKGELLKEFFVPASKRGMMPIQFNLLMPHKSDVINFLLFPMTAIREGRTTDCSTFIEMLATTFFPEHNSQDGGIWQKGANAVFRRTVYSLMDYFLEDEKNLRRRAEYERWNSAKLQSELDDLMGRVSLYNSKLFFSELASKILPNPAKEYAVLEKTKYKFLSAAEKMKKKDTAYRLAKFWAGKDELDGLTVYMNATRALPRNRIRQLIVDAHNTLSSTGSADKMLSSYYGIAIASLSYFDDPIVAKLTSGSPSQNFDIDALSFPRLIRVRIDSDFLRNRHWIGMKTTWDAYSDPDFKNCLGKDFHHIGSIDEMGWTSYAFKGCFPTDTAYLKLTVTNMENSMLQKTFYFRFDKSYQKTLDKKRFVKDKITGEKIIKNGILTELAEYDGKIRSGVDLFKTTRIARNDVTGQMEACRVHAPIICQNTVRYTEKAKMIFLVTPPHMGHYAKLLLIILNQITNMNFSEAYKTKRNQKPNLSTYYMLDELANLKSDGHGIENFDTKLSIGLGQGQYYTSIIQTLQQLKDVYGNTADKALSGNSANLVFMKSNDEEMLSTLETLSGTKHEETYVGKNVLRDDSKMLLKDASEVHNNYNIEKVPAISFNDYLHLPEFNTVVLPAGDFPIWNRNAMIMPPAYELYKDKISIPGMDDGGLADIPSPDMNKEFDVQKNVPDLMGMLEMRLAQAMKAEKAVEIYCEAYQIQESDFSTFKDMDLISSEIMDIIYDLMESDPDDLSVLKLSKFKKNEEALNVAASRKKKMEQDDMKIFGGYFSRSEFYQNGQIHMCYEAEMNEAFENTIEYFKNDTENFTFVNDNCYSFAQDKLLFKKVGAKKAEMIIRSAANGSKTVHGMPKASDLKNTYEVQREFYRFFLELGHMNFASGKFVEELERLRKA